jgi:primase-polymerase (primpol)-like protein
VNAAARSEAQTNGCFPPGILERLRQRGQWMGTRFESRGDGKLDKPPYRVRRGLPIVKRDKTNPQAWATFEEADEALREDRVDAIGLVFTEDDPFGCVDLDDCRTDAGKVEDWACWYVEALPTYWEVSVSGRGLHAILEGKKPEAKCRRGAVELYDRARFLVVTGRHLEGTPTDVQPCQEGFDQLYQATFGEDDRPQGFASSAPGSNLEDNEIPERIMRSRHGSKFNRLWCGDTTGYESPSNADLALCGILAFWTGGDAAQIERLFTRSGLSRQKWTKRSDYRNRTIEKALEGKTEFYTPPLNRKVYARRKGVVSVD